MPRINIKDSYLFLVIIFSGSALPLFREALGLVLLFLVGVLVFWKSLQNIDRRIIAACLVWICFSIVQILNIGKVNIFIWFTYFSKILIGYFLFSYYGKTIIEKYVKIIYCLSTISLFFFCWQLISYGTLEDFLNVFNLGGAFGAKNILVYNLFNDPKFRMVNAINCGFCYEPGPFGGFVAVAIMFLIGMRKSFYNYRRMLVVLVLTLVTTQSSSAYICGIILLAWDILGRFKNKIKRRFAFVAILVVSIVVFSTVPVLQEKITDEFMGINRYEKVIAEYSQTSPNEDLSLGRFVAWQFDWETFKNYPLFGMAPDPDLHQLQVVFQNRHISAINGLGKIFAFYGLFGVILFFISIFKSGNFYYLQFNHRGSWIFPALLLSQGFAFSLIESPFYVMLWLIPFLIPQKIR